jgi:superfamily I DNA/RNA helicase
MTLSPYQLAVIAWVEANVDNPEMAALIVEAVAGSGKTYTIVQAAALIPTSHKAAFLAFNKAIATELAAKLPKHVEAKTLNALGWGACRYNLGNSIKIDRNKTRDLIRRLINDDRIGDVMGELMNLVAKAKSHGLIPSGMPVPTGTYEATTERWTTLMDRYDIDPNGAVDLNIFLGWADQVLKAGLEDTNVMDFDDQLYMPVALNMRTWGYDWIIIDEAQDVSHVQRTLLRKFLKATGKLIAVGDSHQAIYGFRGADSQSLANIGRLFKAETLPLSISYRCPRKIIEIAQQFVPHIQASDTAEEGEVLAPNEWQLDSFTDEDLVVCRNTAPLIELAYKFIADGKPVHVMGREIGKGLINVVRKAAGRRTTTLEDFGPKLDAWTQRMLRKAGEDEAKQDAVNDKTTCIQLLMTGLDTVAELIAGIEKIFNDSTKGTTLATVHKAKGLEAPRVFILEPHLMPSRWARKDWQVEQEANLQYVAVTRALETLVYLPLDIIE